MDFYSHQDRAKRKTFWFFLLFIAGLIIISAAATVAINFALQLTMNTREPIFSLRGLIQVLLPITIVTILISFFKYFSLRTGGKAVAEALQARLIDKKAANANERRLLNVVEEMAIAASLPVPPVYVLDNESGINAFAAGFTINDAVIGVTQGAIDQLTRDELQAVVAHEFSHVLNGDMRINLRFSAILFGFFFLMEIAKLFLDIASRMRLGSSNSKKDAGHAMLAIFLISIICFIAGWFSSLWARMMQATINRQREYLADASSVQFTRHPEGLATALMKIGGNAFGSSLQHTTSDSYNHLFFGETTDSFFSTHPPLEQRIKRIYRAWDGKYIVPTAEMAPEQATEDGHKSKVTREQIVKGAVIAGAVLSTKANNAVDDSRDQPLPFTRATSILNMQPMDEQQALEKLDAICQEPMDACYFIFSLLLDDEPSVRKQQLSVIKNTDLIKKCHQTLISVPEEKHLSFIEKAVPTLKTLSEQQYQSFKKVLMHFIQADEKISLKEWLIYQLITHQVSAQYNTKTLGQSAKHNTLSQIQNEVETMLSALAWLAPTPEAVKSAFGMGANTMGLYTIKLQDNPQASSLTPCLEKLQEASEQVRKTFLRGALRTIEQDKQIDAKEALFFRILSLCLDCPVALN